MEDHEDGGLDIDYEEQAYAYQQRQRLITEAQRRKRKFKNNIDDKGLETNGHHHDNGGQEEHSGGQEQDEEQHHNNHYQEEEEEEDMNQDQDQEFEEEQEDGGNGEGYHQEEEEEEEGEDYRNHDSYENEEEEGGTEALLYCEAQFDDGSLLEDDEEERGLPPVIKASNYADPSTTYTRITTNASGIRIVESSSSSMMEEDGDEEYSDGYYQQQQEQYDQPDEPILTVRKVQMNKPRKIRPEKVAAEAYLRQLQTDAYESFRPNILARKLMGGASISPVTVPHTSRNQNNNNAVPPPPLLQRPKKLPTISLESILRHPQKNKQQASNTSLFPRGSSSSILIGNNLRIKPNHIPNYNKSNMNANTNSSFQKMQMAPRNKFLFQQQINNNNNNTRSLLNPPRTSIQNKNLQVQLQSSSARTNGSAAILNNRLQNSLLPPSPSSSPQKSPKNVPRCPICKRTFATNQVLQRHMVLHGQITSSPPPAHQNQGGQYKYKCDECFEEFPSPLLLNQHLQSHQNQTSPSPSSSSSALHRCRVCYRTFTCAESLKAHALMHDGEFKCRACRRGFSDWAALEEHEATHKRYNCQWCEKYFMNSGNLKAHERIHTGERPYKCADCPKAFKQLGGLQYHLKTNPSHRPQKYHKQEAQNEAQNLSYEEYENSDGILNMSLADIAAANGM